ncbi:hypothetical protein UlMin_043692 [Ulmus minor]
MASPTFNTKKLSLILLLNASFLFLFSLFLKFQYEDHNKPKLTIFKIDACSGLHDYTDYSSKCLYVKTHPGCQPKAYVNYLQFFYCNFGQIPLVGNLLLLLWLVLLFYLLGSTASDYFCPSLESLSKILKLSPTIAGITLLSLGNGAPDVFAIIISFTRSGDGDVGLNSVLGGAFFVSTIVVGFISILISSHNVSVDKTSFVRDVSFFLFSLLSLLVILIVGRINLFGSMCFFAIYFVYVCSVSATHFFFKNKLPNDDVLPLLGCVDDHDTSTQEKEQATKRESCWLGKWAIRVLGLPLDLPRRLTIPVVKEEEWSKPFAVISVTLAPLLVAALFNTQSQNVDPKTKLVTYMSGGLIGMVFGNLSYVTTNNSGPPNQCLFAWLVGAFLMSVTWTYIIAEELVSLLVSLGHIFGISPSILGLTVLAWGNSLGDLIANVAMAVHGGADGAQIAISGCYAGPMFNMLVGIGFALVLSSWTEYPFLYVIPKDPYLYEAVAFLMCGLVWALVVLTKKKMKLDRVLGFGLISIYLCFLFIRVARVVGFLHYQESPNPTK